MIDANNNPIEVGTPVRFQGERFRVLRKTNRGFDVVIQNVEGYRMTVSPLTVEVVNNG